MTPTQSASDLVLLDGPMGSELERAGYALPPPLWSAAIVRDHPQAVLDVHTAYVQAGADVHTTATFRTSRRALAQAGDDTPWERLTQRAVRVCREAVGATASPLPGRVAGSMAPLEDCYRPDLTPPQEELDGEHHAMAHCLVDAGVDLLLVETMPTLHELESAVRAAHDTGLPVWAAITLGPHADCFSGDSWKRAVSQAAQLGAEAFLINCSPAQQISPLLPALAALRDRPPLFGAYANTLFDREPQHTTETFVQTSLEWIAQGARIVGGCCGTSPQDIAALRARLDAGPGTPQSSPHPIP